MKKLQYFILLWCVISAHAVYTPIEDAPIVPIASCASSERHHPEVEMQNQETQEFEAPQEPQQQENHATEIIEVDTSSAQYQLDKMAELAEYGCRVNAGCVGYGILVNLSILLSAYLADINLMVALVPPALTWLSFYGLAMFRPCCIDETLAMGIIQAFKYTYVAYLSAILITHSLLIAKIAILSLNHVNSTNITNCSCV